MGEDGKSLLAEVRSDGDGTDEEVSRKEEAAWHEQVVEGFRELLDREPELRAIFGCLCAGVTESRQIARRLGMDEAAVVRGGRNWSGAQVNLNGG